MESALKDWLKYKCNSRIHGTTRERPDKLFNDKEVMYLQKLPILDFDMASWHLRKVGRDCHINLENNYYSVPFAHVGTEVEVHLHSNLVKICKDDQILAIHIRAISQGIFVTNRSHYPQYKLLYPGSKEYADHAASAMNSIGENGAKMLLFLQDDQNRNWVRIVKGILHLRKTYNDEIVDKACKRALYYGVKSYSKIKEIIQNNCYDLPLPKDAR